jgi:hypothetical protein
VAPPFLLATPAAALSINTQGAIKLHFSHSSPPLRAGPSAEAGKSICLTAIMNAITTNLDYFFIFFMNK